MELRRTGGQETHPQHAIYEYTLRTAEEFDALTYSAAFAEAATDNAFKRELSYTQEEPIVLETGDLPPAFADAFYFPDRPTIDRMRISITELMPTDTATSEPEQIIKGTFFVGTTKFVVTDALSNQIRVSTDNSEGGVLQYQFGSEKFYQLLAVMYTRHMTRTLERLYEARGESDTYDDLPFVGPTSNEVERIVENLVGNHEWQQLRQLFKHLAEYTGKSASSETSYFSPESLDKPLETDRSLFTTRAETFHGSLHQCTVDVSVNWELFGKNTEVSGTSTSVTHKSFSSPQQSGSIQPIHYSRDDYRFMKELFDITNTPNDGVQFTAKDESWLMITSICMTSLRPYLQKYDDTSTQARL